MSKKLKSINMNALAEQFKIRHCFGIKENNALDPIKNFANTYLQVR